MSLQTGARLARLAKPVIDPGTLSIYGYRLTGPLLSEQDSYLRIEDVREVSGIGFIVDSADEFVTKGDIIKLEELLRLRFDLVGLKVIDEKRHRLGKVGDYSVDSSSFYIQQIQVDRGVMRSLTTTEHLIHRSQIVEINDEFIVVKSTAKKAEGKTSLPENFVNPFRSSSPQSQPESIERD